MINLRRHYRCLNKNVKFPASDVIRETLCQRLSLVEYLELKIIDNQSDDFLRMLSKMTYHFPKKILGSRISLTYVQKTYENLTTNLGKILRSFENRAPKLEHTLC